MKTYHPSYYGKFSCIAGDCPDSCCKSWEIVIDENTYNKYLKTEGEIGTAIRSAVIFDETGDRCFALVDGKCPFLNSSGLCDIHIALGEDYTSEICRVHPRFIEEYDGFREITLSLSCPEAARIIVGSPYFKDVYPKPSYNGDDDVLKILIESRESILKYNKTLYATVRELSETAYRDETDINMYHIEDGFVADKDTAEKYCKVLFEKCEILTPLWKTMLEKAVKNNITENEFSEFLISNERPLLNILHYYVYRYYLKAVNDLEIFPRARFIQLNVFASALISLTNSISLVEAARLFSKEIEHSTENIEIILGCISEW